MVDALYGIGYPTSRVGVSALIERFPADFQWDWESFCDPDNLSLSFRTLFTAMHIERELAALYMKSCDCSINVSLPPSKFASSREDLILELSECYTRLGVAEGVESTRELVRQIELQAANLIDRVR